LEKNKYLWLHFIILLWGFTPVLGKSISLQAYDLVWWRLFISSLSLFVFIYFKQHSLHITFKDSIPVIVMGFIVGAHWFFFYHAIKVSNVSIALAGFSTITIFASIMQPILLGKKFFWGDLFYGFIILLGLAFILHYEAFAFAGVLYGVLAALTGAAFGVYNGKLIVKHNSSVITLIEFLGAFFIISIAKLFDGDVQSFVPVLGFNDLIYSLILSILCTTLAFTLSVEDTEAILIPCLQ
jgi:drug/metabolite transporter (DMT)-like permease